MVSHGGPTDSSYAVVAQLNQEWELLREDAREVSCWAMQHLILRGCRDLGDVLAAVPTDPDAVLGALLAEAAAGSPQAARVVLQAMLGKVVLMTRADRRVGVDGYLVAMWECIRTYPLERRRSHIAANLALDARKLARRDGVQQAMVLLWPAGSSFTDVVDRQLARETADHAAEVSMLTAGDVIRAALELQLIDAAAGSLLTSVYAEGLTSKEAADRHLTSADAVRQRCSRAVRALAHHASEIASYA